MLNLKRVAKIALIQSAIFLANCTKVGEILENWPNDFIGEVYLKIMQYF